MAEVPLLKKLADAVAVRVAREHDAALRRRQELDERTKNLVDKRALLQLDEQRRKATGARDALFASLFAELSAAMREGGPVNAIGVCAERAPAIAETVSAERGVKIGRTAHRTRNPDNTPPIWAELILDDLPTQPVYLADRSGRLGAILPIMTASACTQCHGEADALAPGVAGALAERYPHDRATGFAEGDLRGWFWVEVPAEPE